MFFVRPSSRTPMTFCGKEKKILYWYNTTLKLLIVTVEIHGGLICKIIPSPSPILHTRFHSLDPLFRPATPQKSVCLSWRPLENDLCQYWMVYLSKRFSLQASFINMYISCWFFPRTDAKIDHRMLFCMNVHFFRQLINTESQKYELMPYKSM